MQIYEVELTMEELEILRVVLDKSTRPSYALACYASRKAKKSVDVLDKAQGLFKKVNEIIEINTH